MCQQKQLHFDLPRCCCNFFRPIKACIISLAFIASWNVVAQEDAVTEKSDNQNNSSDVSTNFKAYRESSPRNYEAVAPRFSGHDKGFPSPEARTLPAVVKISPPQKQTKKD